MAEIPVDRPPLDPGEVDADQMIAEMRRVTKALVSYGTRLPKELMLFMKDFLFIDAAMTTLAPDLDVVAEMLHISQYFLEPRGPDPAEIGLDPRAIALDPAAWATSIGVEAPEGGELLVTHRDIQRQRQEVRQRMEPAAPRPPPPLSHPPTVPAGRRRLTRPGDAPAPPPPRPNMRRVSYTITYDDEGPIPNRDAWSFGLSSARRRPGRQVGRGGRRAPARRAPGMAEERNALHRGATLATAAQLRTRAEAGSSGAPGRSAWSSWR